MGILRRLQIGMMLFGICMGFVFPVYATFFVEFRPGMQFWFNLGCVIAGISVGAFSYLLVRIILIRRLMKIATACKKISAGCVDVYLDIESPDAVGDIVNGFNTMVANLRALLEKLAEGVKQLNGVSSALVTVNGQLVSTIHQQETTVGRMSQASHEVSTTLSEITDSLKTTAEFSKTVDEQAARASQLLSKSVEGMNRTAEDMGKTIQSVEALKQQSTEISGVLTVIEGIARQTNLLALNASVEAARAGEHGKGFATVAREVRKLADGTAAATKQIAVILKRFEETTQAGVSTIRGHAELTTALRQMLVESAGSLERIISSMTEISSRVQQISVAAGEQTGAYTSIADSMQEISSAFSGISQTTRVLDTEIHSMSAFANQLKATLGSSQAASH